MINWLKRNWAICLLVLIVLYWAKSFILGKSTTFVPIGRGESANYYAADSMGLAAPSAVSKMTLIGRQVAPSETADRLVIQNSSLSLQVKDVPAAITGIENSAKSLGGFLINSNLSRPEGAASGNISVRIPEDKRSEAMTAFKGFAVKVVSESVSGTDVTDQYTDLQSQMEILLTTKQKFEDILDRATTVSDLMNVQQQLINLQNQIDNVKGQQKYYEQSAKLTRIDVYLSTDELALPYAPTNEWRPAVIFKEAVRSLIGTFRDIGSLLIWAAVYLPVLIPIGLLIWYLRRRFQRT